MFEKRPGFFPAFLIILMRLKDAWNDSVFRTRLRTVTDEAGIWRNGIQWWMFIYCSGVIAELESRVESFSLHAGDSHCAFGCRVCVECVCVRVCVSVRECVWECVRVCAPACLQSSYSCHMAERSVSSPLRCDSVWVLFDVFSPCRNHTGTAEPTQSVTPTHTLYTASDRAQGHGCSCWVALSKRKRQHALQKNPTAGAFSSRMTPAASCSLVAAEV